MSVVDYTENAYDIINGLQKHYSQEEAQNIVADMWWPQHPSVMSREDVSQGFRASVATLTFVQPYMWVKSMGELLDQASEGFPDTAAITANSVPSLYGFYWFESALPPRQGGQFNIRAISWYPRMKLPDSNNTFLPLPVGLNKLPTLDEDDSLGITFWTSENGFVMPLSSIVLPLGDALVNADGYGGQHEATQAKLRLIAASFELLSQKIFVSRLDKPPRSVRRRIQKQTGRKDIKDVAIIEMRVRENTPHPTGTPTEREYSNSWVVRGHWRNQWYSSLGIHKAKWIDPHVKGPLDKPLKNIKKVFAVVR